MIEGELVNLRAMEMSDLERGVRWRNDPEVARFLSRVRYPMSALAIEAWLRERSEAPMRFDAELWFAVETKDGRHIGHCDLDAAPEDRKATLGVMIGERDFWDRGYGTDAVRTLVRFAFDEMNLNRVALTVMAPHERAQAAYRKCGFVEEGRLREAIYLNGAYCDQVYMSVLRDDFYAAIAARAREVAR
jgi:RimJ/RimL family protein N-acetyltransferase